MKKFTAVLALLCFAIVPAVMAGTALINSDEDQSFDGYTSSEVSTNYGDSDYHSWTGSDGENKTYIGRSTAGGKAEVWGYFFEGQNSYSWVRMIFDPHNGSTPDQSAYATLTRSFECNTAAEAGNYSIIMSVDVKMDNDCKNEFDGYIEMTDGLRIDFEADDDHLYWDKNDGESTGVVTLTLEDGQYQGGIILTASTSIAVNDVHNATIYVNGHGEDGDDSECNATMNLIPLP